MASAWALEAFQGLLRNDQIFPFLILILDCRHSPLSSPRKQNEEY